MQGLREAGEEMGTTRLTIGVGYFIDPPWLNMTSSTLSILHFNDVYRITLDLQKLSSHPLETIDVVTQFTALPHDLRNKWALQDDGNRDRLVIFSGDVFSPLH